MSDSEVYIHIILVATFSPGTVSCISTIDYGGIDVHTYAHFLLAVPLGVGNAYFEGDEYPILLDDVICNGSEDGIVYCNHSEIGTHDCKHSEDAGVICQGLAYMYLPLYFVLQVSPFAYPCRW